MVWVVLLFFPARSKADNESEELCKEWVGTVLTHVSVGDALKLLEIGTFIAELTIFETIATVTIRFSGTWIFGEGHEATFTTILRHTLRVNKLLCFSIIAHFFEAAFGQCMEKTG